MEIYPMIQSWTPMTTPHLRWPLRLRAARRPMGSQTLHGLQRLSPSPLAFASLDMIKPWTVWSCPYFVAICSNSNGENMVPPSYLHHEKIDANSNDNAIVSCHHGIFMHSLHLEWEWLSAMMTLIKYLWLVSQSFTMVFCRFLDGQIPVLGSHVSFGVSCLIPMAESGTRNREPRTVLLAPTNTSERENHGKPQSM